MAKKSLAAVQFAIYETRPRKGSLLMFFGAEQLAAFEETPMASQAIRALASAVFCVCLLACMRGYTQGQGCGSGGSGGKRPERRRKGWCPR